MPLLPSGVDVEDGGGKQGHDPEEHCKELEELEVEDDVDALGGELGLAGGAFAGVAASFGAAEGELAEAFALLPEAGVASVAHEEHLLVAQAVGGGAPLELGVEVLFVLLLRVDDFLEQTDGNGGGEAVELVEEHLLALLQEVVGNQVVDFVDVPLLDLLLLLRHRQDHLVWHHFVCQAPLALQVFEFVPFSLLVPLLLPQLPLELLRRTPRLLVLLPQSALHRFRHPVQLLRVHRVLAVLQLRL